MKSYEIIIKLQETNSRLDKEQILLDAWDSGNYEFFSGLRWCFDGLKSFGIKQVPASTDAPQYFTDNFESFQNLLIKLAKRQLTGHAARDAVFDMMQETDGSTWDLFFRRILLKDMKCGLSETTVNKVLKKIGGEALNYVIVEFPYQRCCLPKHTDLTKFSWIKGVYSQTKSDGMYLSANRQIDGTVDLLSRAGKAFPLEQFKELEIAISESFLPGTQSHGELLVFENGRELPRQIGNGMLNSIAQGGSFDEGLTPVYVVWDQIHLESAVPKGSCNTPYSNRLESITKQIKAANSPFLKLVDLKLVYSMDEAVAHYIELLSQGYEGTILKEPSAIWKDGTSKLQVKLKFETEIDLMIIGFNPGNGKNAGLFGSILATTSDGLLEVGVSGFKDLKQSGIMTRSEIWDKRDELVGTIMTVTSNSLMKPTVDGGKYSIFLPRFKEFRRDKTEADSLQKVIDQFESVLK